jgi:hypothetical protein
VGFCITNLIWIAEIVANGMRVMAITFFVKSDQSYLLAKMWIPKNSRHEGVVFCHGWGGQPQYDDFWSCSPSRDTTPCASINEVMGNRPERAS